MLLTRASPEAVDVYTCRCIKSRISLLLTATILSTVSVSVLEIKISGSLFEGECDVPGGV